MATQLIHINVNLAAMISELQIAIQRVINLVALGLNANTGLPKGFQKLPGAYFEVSLAQNLSWDEEKSKSEFFKWVLINGFRDASELVNNFLETANRVLSVWELVIKQKGEAKLTGEDWNEIIINGSKRFHRLGLPDKIKHLSHINFFQLDPELTKQILTINAARNCLVHRKGIVSERDANIDGELEVRWTKLSLYLKNESGEQEIIPPQIVEKDNIIAVKNVHISKTFAIGKKIVFSAQEFSDICWCLFLFGQSTTKCVEEIGRNNGFVADNKGST
jgi:hypothetical protein